MIRFIETPVFTRQVVELMTDVEYSELQAALVLQPDLGELIQASGGLRKIRWSEQGRGSGKRGGFVLSTTGIGAARSFTCCSCIQRKSKMTSRLNRSES